MSNLPAFLYATSIGKKVLCAQQYYIPKLPINKILSFEIPPIFVSSKVGLKTDADKAVFAAKVGGEPIKYGNRETYCINKPTMESVLSLPISELDPNTPSPPNATSILGFRSLLTTWKIITLFLATQTYPAFTSEEQISDANNADVDLVIPLTVDPSPGYRYTAAQMEGLQLLGMSKEALESELGIDGDEMMDPEVNTTCTGGVFVAKPAPFYPLTNVGSPSEIPALPGFVFPYFSGCLVPETAFLSSVMAEFFFGCFGNSREEAAVNYKTWVTGFEKWYKTEEGKRIQHVFLGVKLAVQAQARLFIIVSQDKYLGFAVLGCRFSIAIHGNVLSSDTAEIVRQTCADLDKHSKSLAHLCTMLSKMDLSLVGKKVEVAPRSLRNTRALVTEFRRREEISDDDWADVEQHWQNITFTEKFWPMTHNCIARAVSMIMEEEREITMDLPMYLPASLIYKNDRVSNVLSVFGPMAPSFLDMKGTDFPIPSAGEIDTADSIDLTTGKRGLEAILVSGKKLENAADDFLNVMKKRRIRQNLAERAAGFRTMRFVGQARDEIWAALKLLPALPSDNNGKKRARDEEGDSGEGSSRKKGRLIGAVDDFNLLDF